MTRLRSVGRRLELVVVGSLTILMAAEQVRSLTTTLWAWIFARPVSARYGSQEDFPRRPFSVQCASGVLRAE